MKKKILLVVMATVLALGVLTGCSESYKVSQNVSQEADNFNVTRKLTVINARTDTVLLELTGTFALQNNNDNELEVIIETAEGKYKKDLVYLNDYLTIRLAWQMGGIISKSNLTTTEIISMTWIHKRQKPMSTANMQ